jgi:hypothetical protein
LKDTIANDTLYSISERFMYGTDSGPFGFSKGSSYINLDLNVKLQSGAPGDYSVKLLYYHDALLNVDLPNVNLCEARLVLPQDVQQLKLESFPLAASADGKEYSGKVASRLDVAESGLIYALLQTCPPRDNTVLTITGDVVFKNPYGFLPGTLASTAGANDELVHDTISTSSVSPTYVASFFRSNYNAYIELLHSDTHSNLNICALCCLQACTTACCHSKLSAQQPFCC